MGAVFGPQSKSRTGTYTFSGVNNSDAGSVSASALVAGRGNTATLPGGYTFGKGSTLNLTTDGGGYLAGLKALSIALDQQAGLTREALSGFNGLAETKITDGANITSGTTRVALYVVGGIAAVVMAFLFFRR